MALLSSSWFNQYKPAAGILLSLHFDAETLPHAPANILATAIAAKINILPMSLSFTSAYGFRSCFLKGEASGHGIGSRFEALSIIAVISSSSMKC
jgi:hypothetical protein